MQTPRLQAFFPQEELLWQVFTKLCRLVWVFLDYIANNNSLNYRHPATKYEPYQVYSYN